jgi:hypothetical protein
VVSLVLFPLPHRAFMHPDSFGDIAFMPSFVEQKHCPPPCLHLLFFAKLASVFLHVDTG